MVGQPDSCKVVATTRWFWIPFTDAGVITKGDTPYDEVHQRRTPRVVDPRQRVGHPGLLELGERPMNELAIQKILLHGFALKPNDHITYMHPKLGLMMVEIKDRWPSYRQGRANWVDLWSVPTDADNPSKPVAIALLDDYASFSVYPQWANRRS